MNPIRCRRCDKVVRSSESRWKHLCAQCDSSELRLSSRGRGPPVRLCTRIRGPKYKLGEFVPE
jgi:hypothetical protein